MPLQDLTPQLRTRLSRMERAVGWFVVLAVVLLGCGFVYYVYHTAERKGWFRTKAPYFTFTANATGLKVGDPVTLMGLDVGQITRMEPMPPEEFQYNMYVEFELREPYYGYIWTKGSYAIVAPASLLGSRTLEVTKGTNGFPAYVFHPLRPVTLAEARDLAGSTNWVLAEEVYAPDSTNLVATPFQRLTHLAAIAAAGVTNLLLMDISSRQKLMTGIWNDQEGRYEPYTKRTKPYWLLSNETPAVSEQVQGLVAQVRQALPGILNLTNQLTDVLTNSAALTSNLNVIAVSARPAVSNLTLALGQLNRPGALGEWLLPPDVTRQLEGTLSTAHDTLASADTNLTMLASNLNRSLNNLAGITSNLNQQVAANPEMLTAISQTVTHADQFIQGLKRFWLFRHLFPAQPAAKPAPPPKPVLSPKAKSD